MATCSGMGGRIRPESVEALERNDWKDYPGIRSLDCIDGFPKRNKINRVGIYFSRFGFLCEIRIKNAIDDFTYPKFLKWFQRRASRGI